MNDIWVCASCKSINRARVDRCYRCASRREAAMPAMGPGPRVETAVASRAVRRYAATWPFAVVASVLILAVAALGLFLILEQAGGAGALKDAAASTLRGGEDTVTAAMLAEDRRLAFPSLVRAILLIIAVLSFGLWLSRVVLNIPALGGGTPGTSPMKALIYPLIPIVNLVKVPGMIQDTMYRLDPRAGGVFMVLLAWLGFVGSWVVSVVGTWAITGAAVTKILALDALAQVPAIIDQMVDQLFLLAIVAEAMIAGGAVLLVVIIVRVERRAAARDREIRAAALAAGG